jgi:hypothetical protein
VYGWTLSFSLLFLSCSYLHWNIMNNNCLSRGFTRWKISSSIKPSSTFERDSPVWITNTYSQWWIRIGFNADPDPQTYAMWSHKKLNISFKIILKLGNRLKTNRYLRRCKSFFERHETRFICKFCSWIRIRILNRDPGQPNECESGSTTLSTMRLQ